jgi:hypothetical protein
MNEPQPSTDRVFLVIPSSVCRALSILRHSIAKFLVTLAIVVLLVLVLVLGCTRVVLGWILVAGVIIIFGYLILALLYTEMQLRYAMRTEEQLKRGLREVRTKLDEETTGQKPLAERLFRALDTRFDTEELRTLCFDLFTMYPDQMTGPDLDYDNLAGEGKTGKARELVRYCQRREMIEELVEAVRRRRSKVDL